VGKSCHPPLGTSILAPASEPEVALQLRTRSADETRALGHRLGGAVRAGDVILLRGPLGGGKTVLVQGMAAGLGATVDVISPTFVLVRHYRGRLELVHADLYRLESRREIDELGLEELAAAGVLVVEWSDRAPWLEESPGVIVLELEAAAGGAANDRSVAVQRAPQHLLAALSG